MSNILFISHTGGGGGGETVLLDVIRASLADMDVNVFIALPNDGNDAFVDGLCDLAERCVIERFAFRPIRNSLSLLMRNLGYGVLLGLPKLVKFIEVNKIDLVYVNSSVNVVAIMAARRANRPYVWHIHEQSNNEHRWAPRWFNKFYKEGLFDKSCHSVFVSKTSYDLWLNDLEVAKIPQSHVLYSPFKQININQVTERRPFTFGFIGSLNTNKNVGRLIEAFNLLDKGCRLVIGGTGESEAQLRTLAKRDTKIEFMGQIGNLDKFYNRIDCLVVPSLNESWGLVALEAMSARIPVVMTKNSGLVELFDNEKECVFVEPTSVEAIAEAMRKVVENPAFAKTIIEAATKKIGELDMNNNFPVKLLSIINGARE